MHIPGSIVTPYAHILAKDDAARVYILVYHEGSDAGNALAVDNRPVDRSGTAVLRQKGGMQVECAQLGHAPDLLRQHAERHHHEEIRLPFRQRRQELRIFQFHRLKHGQAMLDRIFLDGTFVHFEAASAGFIRHRDHAHHLVAGLDQGIQRSHRELGRAHEHNAFRAEEAGHLALELAPVVQQRIVAEEGGILDCPRSQIGPNRG